MPYFIIFTALFVIWIQIEKRKSEKSSKKESKEFWSKEYNSNFVRKKDISHLNYITIPLDSLPFMETSNEDLSSIQNQIKTLAGKKILNLTGYTNTDLKLNFGTANLAILSEYDQNYMTMVRTIYKWGEFLYKAGEFAKAKSVLLFGIDCKTDISGNYTLLAELYAKDKEPEKILLLIESAKTLQSLLKDSIITSLNSIYESSNHVPE